MLVERFNLLKFIYWNINYISNLYKKEITYILLIVDYKVRRKNIHFKIKKKKTNGWEIKKRLNLGKKEARKRIKA